MSKVRVPILNQPGKSAVVENGATVGATIGKNLYNADGSLFDVSQVQASAQESPADTSVVAWKFIQDIPENVKSVEGLNTSGLVIRQSNGPWETRSIEGVAGETTSANENGAGGNPTIGLWTVGNTASGALLSVEVDIKGRIIGYRDADAIDIIDALGYTPEPAIAAGTTAQFLRGDKTWSNALTGDIIVASNVRIGNGFSGVASNLAIGPFAMSVANLGTSNTAVGAQALGFGGSGDANTAVGHETLRVNTGNSNTAVGRQAMRNSTTGTSNAALGVAALVNNSSGNFNSSFGQSSLLSNTTGSRNVAVGYDAGRTGVSANANVSGNDNTYIGNRAGPGTPTQLSFVTVIGSGALVTTDNTIVFGRAATDVAVIGATGNSGGGCKLQITGHIGVLGAGNGLRVAEGANAKQGVATLVAGTVTVANTSVTANSRIFLTIQNPNGGTPGAVYIAARVAGTSFTITSTNGADVSTVAYEIFEPGT